MGIASRLAEAVKRPWSLERTAHTMRLFPDGQGAKACTVIGIASLCDWVVLSDRHPPALDVRKRRKTHAPRHIFLSMRDPKTAIDYFHDTILPELSERFVLISGSEDVTLPNQIDARWDAFDRDTRQKIDRLADDPRLIHWFCENLDEKWSPRVSPMPTGFVAPGARMNRPYTRPKVRNLADRPLVALCGHHVRDGKQWETRRRVDALARSDWRMFTKRLSRPVTEREYLSIVETCSFVLCVEGGGLDPSPKAWQSIQYGAIPIIRRSPLAAAYADLPCLFVDTWESEALSVERLAEARATLLPHFDTVDGRAATLDKLSLAHWWRKVTAMHKKTATTTHAAR